MTVYLTSAVICLCGVELLLRAPLRESLATLMDYAGRSSRVISSKNISDHWKEKVLPTYSKKVAQATLELFGVFVVVFGLLGLLALGLDAVVPGDANTLEFLSSGPGILYATVISVAYFYARRAVVGR